MRAFHTFVLRTAGIALILASGAYSQDALAKPKPPLIDASITMKQNSFPPSEKPWVTLTMKNITDHNIFPDSDIGFRMHVEGKNGEPKLTLYHRQLRHEPGVQPLTEGGPGRFPINVPGEKPWEGIPPGGVDVMKFDLSYYYELVPGHYTVYFEVLDKGGAWLHTNTAKFEIQAPPQ